MTNPKLSYSELFRDPRWQKRRLEILQSANFTCVECGNTQDEFHIHHRYYVPGRMPWDYPDFALLAVCRICHEKEHLTAGDIHFLEQWLELIEAKGLKQEAVLRFVEALYGSKYDPHSAIHQLTEEAASGVLSFDNSILKENVF